MNKNLSLIILKKGLNILFSLNELVVEQCVNSLHNFLLSLTSYKTHQASCLQVPLFFLSSSSKRFFCLQTSLTLHELSRYLSGNLRTLIILLKQCGKTWLMVSHLWMRCYKLCWPMESGWEWLCAALCSSSLKNQDVLHRVTRIACGARRKKKSCLEHSVSPRPLSPPQHISWHGLMRNPLPSVQFVV